MSLKDLLNQFPYFLTRKPDSNFVKIVSNINDGGFYPVYQAISDLYYSTCLFKPVMIHKEPLKRGGKYVVGNTIYFESVLYNDYIESVIIRKNDKIIYTKLYELSDEATHFEYSLEDLNDNPTDTEKYTLTVNTFNELTYSKGYPENDTVENNIYDHDYSIDKLGKLLNVPRLNLTPPTDTSLFYKTYPSYFKYNTEFDYEYLNRIIEYVTNYWTTPLPLLELQKRFRTTGTSIKNRDHILCKMGHYFKYDEQGEPIYSEGGTGSILPVANEDLYCLCDYNTLFPVIGSYFILLCNAYTNVLKRRTGYFNIYVSVDGGHFEFIKQLENVESETAYTYYQITDKQDFYIIVKYYRTKDLADTDKARKSLVIDEFDVVSRTFKITPRDYTDGDIYVAPDGDDTNPGTMDRPFLTVEHAFNVASEGDMVVLLKEKDKQTTRPVFNINYPLSVPNSLFLVGEDSEYPPIINTTNSGVIFLLGSNCDITCLNVTYHYGDKSYDSVIDVFENKSDGLGASVCFAKYEESIDFEVGTVPKDEIKCYEKTIVYAYFYNKITEGYSVSFYDDDNKLIGTGKVKDQVASVEYYSKDVGELTLKAFLVETGDIRTVTVRSVEPIVSDYFVDYYNGNDSNTGAITSPWKTLNYAFKQIGSNEVVTILNDYPITSPYPVVEENVVLKQKNNSKVYSTDGNYFVINKGKVLFLENIHLGNYIATSDNIRNKTEDTITITASKSNPPVHFDFRTDKDAVKKGDSVRLMCSGLTDFDGEYIRFNDFNGGLISTVKIVDGKANTYYKTVMEGENTLTATLISGSTTLDTESVVVMVYPSTSVDYYVDYTNGNNSNTGLKGSPWKTLEYALTQVHNYDTIHLLSDITITTPLNVSVGEVTITQAGMCRLKNNGIEYFNLKSKSKLILDNIYCNDEYFKYEIFDNTGTEDVIVELNISYVPPTPPAESLKFECDKSVVVKGESVKFSVEVLNPSKSYENYIVTIGTEDYVKLGEIKLNNSNEGTLTIPADFGTGDITIYAVMKELMIYNTVSLKIQEDLQYDYYVDNVNGDDSNNGSQTHPFKTLQKATSVAKQYGCICLLTDVDINTPINIKNSVYIGSETGTTITNLIDNEFFTILKGKGLQLVNIYLNTSQCIDETFYAETTTMTVTNGVS